MQWIEPEDIQIPAGFQQVIGGHPLVSKMLVRRGITNEQEALKFLDADQYRPAPAGELPGMSAACDIISEAIKQRQKICVWGDFDVDGQTATTILVSALKKIGTDVIFHIPNRDKESHGIKISFLQKVMEQNIDILLTCDTGISAHDAIAYAAENGIKTIVTDHHDLPETLPPADAVIDPKMLAQEHPLNPLSGAAVAYKLVEALFEEHNRPGECREYLDLVALSLIADVAPLYGDSRYLAQIGLDVLRNTGRTGLRELMALAGVTPLSITEEHIGFEIAPRLNALGRLSDAQAIVEFFTTQSIDRARILANQLEGLNNHRKLITEQIYQAALAQIENDPSLLDYAALVLSHSAWHPGIIGLVASRLVEKYHKPTILLVTPADGVARGSARSIEGVDISSAIRQNESLLLGFGGHPMAAGMSMPIENVAKFRRALSRTIQQMVNVDELKPQIKIDAYLDLSELNLDFAEQMERLAPFGAANPPLMLASRHLVVKRQKYLGKAEKHLLITVADQKGNEQDVIWWRAASEDVPQRPFDLAYHLHARTYLGNRDLSLVWHDAREEIETSPIEIQTGPTIEVFDFRNDTQPLHQLKLIMQEKEVQVWAEDDTRLSEYGKKRHELAKKENLVIWTSPPSNQLLSEVLHRTKTKRLYLFAENPEIDRLDTFLKRLAGYSKYAISKKNGNVNLTHLAAATAQRSSAIRLGLSWLEENGFICLGTQDGENITIEAGQQEKSDEVPWVYEQLKSIWSETAAFRSYYAKIDKNRISKNFE